MPWAEFVLFTVLMGAFLMPKKDLPRQDLVTNVNTNDFKACVNVFFPFSGK
jgi:hypothetical protein